MESKNLTCICCPLGCALKVDMEGSEVKEVTGNGCKRGKEYGAKEVTNPTRIVTSSVIVTGALCKAVPVKTASDIPKARVFDVVRALKGVSVSAPVHIGDVILSNVAGTDVDIVATKEISTI